jgi:SAM-dependent methyltransferase
MTSPASDPPMFADAAAYQRFMGRYSDLLAHEFARAARVEAGRDVVDVGCGTGALTTVLADIAGAEHVAGVDPSPPFVEQARARVPGADLRVAAAEALPFPDHTFDVAVSQLVFHFVSDPSAAVREMTRVTRPGGRVAACVWDMTGGMKMIRAFWDSARAVGSSEPAETERFGGRPGQLADLWRGAGLRDVEDRTLTVSADYPDYDELWESFLGASGPIGVCVTTLTEPQRDALAAALHERLGSPAGAFTLTASAWYAAGIV